MAETKVILTKTVANLGHSGDVVEVKAGYARNYLIPQGLAFAWNKGAASQIEAMRRARLAKAVATREEAVAAKAQIEGTVVEIAAKVSESGKLSVAFLPTRLLQLWLLRPLLKLAQSRLLLLRQLVSSQQPLRCIRKSLLPSL